MRVLVDTNVVLDVFLARQPFVLSSAKVFGLVEQSRVEGYLCATTLTTVDYLLAQSFGATERLEAMRKLLALFEVALVNRPVIEEALQSRITDFEDAVLEQSARLAGVEAIVTRNTVDFRRSCLKTLAPDELCVMVGKSSKGGR